MRAVPATRIRLTDFSSPPMRAFHMTWFAFFLCFVAWFGTAPLMPVIREELQLSREQIGWCIIGSVAITIFARLLVGWLCDRIGPRLTYTGLLLVGALPVMGIGLAHDYRTFLIFRISIGLIGASFVITQYHTSRMFAPNCVGTVNATTAGWGNLGGGAAQILMPALLALFVTGLGFSSAFGWRACMFVTGLACGLTGVAYYFLTQDTPAGNLRDLRRDGLLPAAQQSRGAFLEACRDPRVWVLFVLYGACFGVELTINNMAALYFVDHFEHFQSMDEMQAMTLAGLIAGLHGLLNLFARTLGGAVGDRCGRWGGLRGRVQWLFLAVLCEGLFLMWFSRMTTLVWAIPVFILFSLFVEMSCGATYSVVPFLRERGLGAVAGIVGAGGNVGAVAAGFLLKSSVVTWPTALLILGGVVAGASFLCLTVRFAEADSPASSPELSGPELPGTVSSRWAPSEVVK